MHLTVDSEFDHEKVLVVRRKRSGLVAVIAFHSTVLGPACGGMRYRRYPSLTEGMVDALRLSRAMTLKNAAAGLDWGGGKLCVMDDGDEGRRIERLQDLADVLNEIGGEYIVGKDVGARIADMDVMAAKTRWLVGKSEGFGGLGDPSPATAETVLGAMQAAAQVRWGTADMAGRSASVIGVGGVGGSLVKLLAPLGVRLIVSDADPQRAAAVAAEFGATVARVDDSILADVDFLAPCAVGEMITDAHVTKLRCRIIAGGANNPLVSNETADRVCERGILYVPDFLANAGGVIQNAVEFKAGDMDTVARLVRAANERTRDVLERAARDKVAPYLLAIEDVRRRLAERETHEA